MYFGDPSQLGSGAQVLKVSQRINLVKFKAEIPLKSNLVKFKAKISISLTFVSSILNQVSFCLMRHVLLFLYEKIALAT